MLPSVRTKRVSRSDGPRRKGKAAATDRIEKAKRSQSRGATCRPAATRDKHNDATEFEFKNTTVNQKRRIRSATDETEKNKEKTPLAAGRTGPRPGVSRPELGRDTDPRGRVHSPSPPLVRDDKLARSSAQGNNRHCRSSTWAQGRPYSRRRAFAPPPLRASHPWRHTPATMRVGR